jgi:hypothetical protein
LTNQHATHKGTGNSSSLVKGAAARVMNNLLNNKQPKFRLSTNPHVLLGPVLLLAAA